MGIRELPSGRYRLQMRRSSLRVDEVFETEGAAQKAMEGYLKASINGLYSSKTGGVTVDEAWVLYRETRQFLEKKPNTRRSEETHIKPALKYLGERAVKTLTADDVDAFIVRLTKQKKAPDTIRNGVAALSAVLNFCKAKQILKTNVTIGVSRPSKLPEIKRMPAAHQGALMKALLHPKYRYRAVARLALLVRETGARPGEWAAARWDDVQFEKQKIVFTDTKYKRMPRTVPITRAAMALLSAQLEDVLITEGDRLGAAELVFPTVGTDGELRPIQWTGALRDMKKDELLPKGLRAHNGRHEFISTLVESSDLDDSRIMSLVGHHSPASMKIYTHARNLRFLPQLEALEGFRRKDRSGALASALGVPKSLVDAYLEHTRGAEGADNLADGGNELLYEADAIEKLSSMAAKLGTTESERLETLLAIRERVRKRSAKSGSSPKTMRVKKETR
jgi:integrase